MKRLVLLLLLMPFAAFAQTAARFDLPVLPTTPATTPVGSLPPVLAVTNATVSVCGYPATMSGGMCTNTITTYTDSTEATACPSTAQLTPSGSSACVSTTGLQGGLGFWYDTSITHMTYTVRANWGTSGPYDIAPPAGSGFTAATDLSGSQTAQTVVGFRGIPLASGTPANGQTWIYNSGSNSYQLGSPGGSPGGSNQQLQFNNSSSFGGAAQATYNTSTNVLAAKLSANSSITPEPRRRLRPLFG